VVDPPNAADIGAGGVVMMPRFDFTMAISRHHVPRAHPEERADHQVAAGVCGVSRIFIPSASVDRRFMTTSRALSG